MITLAFLTNLAGPDGLLLLMIVLLLFGAKKLPELAKGMGQAVREFSRAKDEIEREVSRPPAEAPRALYEPKSDVGVDVTKQDNLHHEIVHEGVIHEAAPEPEPSKPTHVV